MEISSNTLLIVVYCLMYTSECKSPCPENFIRYEHTCLYFSDSTDKGDWFSVREYCESVTTGSQLVEIDDQDLQTYLTTMAGTYSGNFWIGMNDGGQGQTWVWLNPKRSVNDTYTNWEGIEDENVLLMNCGLMKSDGTWAGKNCSNENRYICACSTGVY